MPKLNFWDMNASMNNQFTYISIYKSTTLNPMVKSDLMTYRGETIRFLFFSVANPLN